MIDPLPNRAKNNKKGKALRARVPREAHAEPHGPLDRNAVAILAEGDASRVPELLPERYKRMTENAFAFLRGAAVVMASDLAQQPTAGAPVQACGDCHLMNFGAFSTPEDNILFDINDFDETLPRVDFTVDLKRLAASVAVAAENANLPKKRARALAAATVASYRERMIALASLSPLEIWHSQINLEQELKVIRNRELKRNLTTIIGKARQSGLEKDDNYPHLVRGDEPKLADKPPTIFHLDPNADTRHNLDAARAFELYRIGLPPERLTLVERYQMKDLAFKAVGVGSIGTFCCVGLFLSGSSTRSKLPRFLHHCIARGWRFLHYSSVRKGLAPLEGYGSGAVWIERPDCPPQEPMTDAELWADMKKPSRRRFHQMTPYQRHYWPSSIEGCGPKDLGNRSDP